jgi:tRNA pseudouridine38-40 synthase
LADAIHRVTGEVVLPQGSGRTDAGVHARGQVASFSLAAPIPAVNLMRALNRTLPSSICVLSAEMAGEDFHARHSAIAKTYEYRVVVADPFAGSFCLPWEARFVYAIERPLHIDRMQEAAANILGIHDFTSFAATDPDRAQRLLQITGQAHPEANTRTILESTWTQSDLPGELGMLIYRVTGNGFLHHMVRNLVGTFLEIGWGERPAAGIPAILAAHDRSAAGRTAPARGLFLHHVDYRPEIPASDELLPEQPTPPASA